MKSQSLPLASPVSQQALLETSEGQTTPAGSGRRLLQSYTPLIQHGCSLKMCLASLLLSKRWHSSIFALRWKVSATRFNRLLFRLVPSMPNTDATEFGSSQDAMWRTPQASEAGARVETLYTKDGEPARPGERAYRKQPDGRMVLQSVTIGQQVKMWPTPTSHLAKETNAPSEANRNEPSISSIVGGSLNPQFVEWLMGYPKDWTAVEDFASGRKKTMKSQELPPE